MLITATEPRRTMFVNPAQVVCITRTDRNTALVVRTLGVPVRTVEPFGTVLRGLFRPADPVIEVAVDLYVAEATYNGLLDNVVNAVEQGEWDEVAAEIRDLAARDFHQEYPRWNDEVLIGLLTDILI